MEKHCVQSRHCGHASYGNVFQAQAGWLQHDFGHLSVFGQSKWNHWIHKFVIGHLKVSFMKMDFALSCVMALRLKNDWVPCTQILLCLVRK